MNQGLHYVDLLRWMCGPVASAYAQARTAAHLRLEVEDVICATIAFENGAVGTILASTSQYPAFPARLGLHGTRGGAVIEGDSLAAFSIIDGEHYAGEAPKAHAVQVAAGGTRAATPPLSGSSDASPVGVDSWTEGHRRQFRDFIDAAETGKSPLVGGSQGRNTVELVELVYRSARSGRVETRDTSAAGR
jgi:predicted dehydrogenase